MLLLSLASNVVEAENLFLSTPATPSSRLLAVRALSPNSPLPINLIFPWLASLVLGAGLKNWLVNSWMVATGGAFWLRLLLKKLLNLRFVRLQRRVNNSAGFRVLAAI